MMRQSTSVVEAIACKDDGHPGESLFLTEETRLHDLKSFAYGVFGLEMVKLAKTSDETVTKAEKKGVDVKLKL